MPQEKIIIKFKPEGHEDLIRAINRLNVATQNFKNQTLKTTKTMGAFEQRNTRLTDVNNKGAKAFSTIRSKLLLFNFAMGLGVAQLIKFTEQATKLQDVRRAFDTLQGGAGRGAIAINKLKEATDDTVSEFDLFQQANNAMILGVTKNSDEMAEMFDIAQRLGQALGRDTKESVESLITGIGRQSRMMLDNIGIVVKSDEAYKAYADELGITVEQLTEAERKTAFLQATMEAAREKVAGLSDEQLSNSQELQRMKVAAVEAAAALGEALMPIVIPLAKGLTLLAQGAKLVFEAFDPSKIGLTFIDTVEELEFLKSTLKGTEGTIKALGGKFVDTFGVMSVEFAQQDSNTQRLTEEYFLLIDQIKELEERMRELLELDNEKPAVIEREITARQRLLGVLTEEQQKKLEIGQAGLAIAGEMLGQFNDMTSAMSAGVNARMKNEMDALKATSAYQRADGDKRKAMEKGVTDSYAQERTRLAKFEKASNLAQAGINIATAITKVLPNVILASLVAAMGAVQIAAIASTPIPKFARGGMIGGRRHSQGGTMIEAEAGEFIMSRSAVQSVGIENLNRMNEGGGGGTPITVNVSGNVLSQDFVEGELAENIKEAIRRGTDFGIG